jgi:hypothetical protein
MRFHLPALHDGVMVPARVLAEIEALGLDLLEVRQLKPQRKSPEQGDSRSP